jgi:hypothetical protein
MIFNPFHTSYSNFLQSVSPLDLSSKSRKSYPDTRSDELLARLAQLQEEEPVQASEPSFFFAMDCRYIVAIQAVGLIVETVPRVVKMSRFLKSASWECRRSGPVERLWS